MKLIIDIPEEDYKFINDVQNLIIGGRGACKTIQNNVINAIRNGKPLMDITDEQISDAFLCAIANYWEEKSKYLTPPPTPVRCHDCSNEKNGTFVSSPTEVVKVGEPLSNPDEISTALEKGELYKRGFEDARERYERPQGEWITKGYEPHGRCNICGEICEINNFCGNCGADMRGTTNES